VSAKPFLVPLRLIGNTAWGDGCYASAISAARKKHQRKPLKVRSLKGAIERMLKADLSALRKKQQTAHRIWTRLRQRESRSGGADNAATPATIEQEASLGHVSCGFPAGPNPVQ
jgi:hypothetical protein